jgi:hypothetical protein
MLRTFLAALLLGTPALLAGCSVAMAAGARETNLTDVHAGSTRGQIEGVLGPPESQQRSLDGAVATYRVTLRDPGSTHPTRALENGFLDVITLGLAEFAQYPEEKAVTHDRVFEVSYDASDVARQITMDGRAYPPEARTAEPPEPAPAGSSLPGP